MADPTGESKSEALRLDFDRRLLLRFRGSTITSDAGLLAYRDLDDALNLTDTAAETLADARTGKNGHHRLAGLLRQSVFGRLAGYEDVNDAERLCRDPAMRWVVGDRAITGYAASASQMGRFETKWLCPPRCTQNNAFQRGGAVNWRVTACQHAPRDLPLLNPPEGTILVSQRPGIRGMSVYSCRFASTSTSVLPAKCSRRSSPRLGATGSIPEMASWLTRAPR
jgi:hypothetical protein